MKKKSGPAFATLDTVDAAASFVEGNEVAVVGFFEDAESAAAKAFASAAGGNDDVPFGLTTSAEVRAAHATHAGDSGRAFSRL